MSQHKLLALELQIEVGAGASIQQAAAELQWIADQLQMPVSTTFNGTPITAHHQTNPPAIIQQYWISRGELVK